MRHAKKMRTNSRISFQWNLKKGALQNFQFDVLRKACLNKQFSMQQNKKTRTTDGAMDYISKCPTNWTRRPATKESLRKVSKTAEYVKPGDASRIEKRYSWNITTIYYDKIAITFTQQSMQTVPPNSSFILRRKALRKSWCNTLKKYEISGTRGATCKLAQRNAKSLT